MFVAIVYTLVPVILYFLLPKFLEKFSKKSTTSKYLLVIAAGLFIASRYLPSPLINGQNTDASMHFFGGGIFGGFIWLFIRRDTNFKMSWTDEILSLYFLISGLGVANELFEMFLNGSGLSQIPSGDTWWDLLANSLGALMFWLCYKLFARH